MDIYHLKQYLFTHFQVSMAHPAARPPSDHFYLHLAHKCNTWLHYHKVLNN